MKVLCPVDFSIASVDAVRYSIGITNKFTKPHIELLHCSWPGEVSGMFDDYVEHQRKILMNNLETLSENMKTIAPEVIWTEQIIHGNPLEEISGYVNKSDFDLVVIGTKGLQNPRDRMFGSITESLFEESAAPIIAIPQGYVFHKLKTIVFAVDDEIISSEEIIKPLTVLAKQYKSDIKVLHVKDKGERPLEYNLDLDFFLKGLSYEYYSKSGDGSLTKSINEVCRHEEADLLCMVHRDRGWMLNVMHRSVIKEELDQLSMPILILHD